MKCENWCLSMSVLGNNFGKQLSNCFLKVLRSFIFIVLYSGFPVLGFPSDAMVDLKANDLMNAIFTATRLNPGRTLTTPMSTTPPSPGNPTTNREGRTRDVPICTTTRFMMRAAAATTISSARRAATLVLQAVKTITTRGSNQA